MKTIQQLLELAKNPYYKFTNDEKAVLDDFLAQKQDTPSTTSQKTSSNKSSEKTPVRVRNVVQKTHPYPADAIESVS